MTKIAVASRSFSRHPQLRRELLARHSSVTFNEAGRSLTGPALIDFLRGHDGAIVGLEIVDESVLRALPELRIVAKYGVGLDGLDLPAVARFGVRLGWRPGVNKRSVSELVVAFAIALLRRVPEAYQAVREGRWGPYVGRNLTERTVGIVGCGEVGKDLADLMRPFRCRILAHDIRDFPEFYRVSGVHPVGIETLLAESDIVSLHLPLNASTRNILSAERLALMRPSAVLVNCARGGLVDEAALADALRSGRIAAAAFDVFATEPPSNSDLLMLPNFLCTPHIGGSAEEAILAMGRAAIDGLDQAEVPRPGSEAWRAAGADMAPHSTEQR